MIPEPALRFGAEQLRVGSEALAAYAARPQTRREQLDALRSEFGFCMFAPGHGRELLAWMLPVALATTNASAIAAALMDELRRRRIIAPGPSVIERLVAVVLVVAERRVADHPPLVTMFGPSRPALGDSCSGLRLAASSPLAPSRRHFSQSHPSRTAAHRPDWGHRLLWLNGVVPSQPDGEVQSRQQVSHHDQIKQRIPL